MVEIRENEDRCQTFNQDKKLPDDCIHPSSTYFCWLEEEVTTRHDVTQEHMPCLKMKKMFKEILGTPKSIKRFVKT